MDLKASKPLGRKGYGSTPHLPGSRVGPGDWHIHEGQAKILTEKARDRHDRVIVTEKLDGSCVAVAKHEGRVLAITRAGYLASASPFTMHHLFEEWVSAREKRFAGLLADGERCVGEWLALAHGTRYVLPSVEDLFVGFAIVRGGNERLCHDEVRERFAAQGVIGAHVISDGPPVSQDEALELAGQYGRHGAIDPIEGAVWVCERKGRFDFIAKHVVQGKVDGLYLSQVTGREDVYNQWPGAPSAGAFA